jgi:predicted patatin/cPLA2 family phospholipase
MRTEKKVKKELELVLERYKEWNNLVDQKQILYRNTAEEIEQIDKMIKQETILPLIAELKWIQLNKN